MDIKRLLLALALSFVFMVTYTWIFGVPEEAPSKPAQPNLSDESNLIKDSTDVNVAKNTVPINEKSQNTYDDGWVRLSPDFGEDFETDLMKINMTRGGTSIKTVSIIEKDNSGHYKYQGMWDDSACSDESVNDQCESIYKENKPVQILNSHCNPCLFVGSRQELVEFTIEKLDTTDAGYIIKSVSNPEPGRDYEIIKTTSIQNDSYILLHAFQLLRKKV